MIINSEDYGQVNVQDALMDDISSFYGISIEEVSNRLANYHRSERASAWRRDNPQTPEEIKSFYQRYDFYVWQLTLFNSSTLYDAHMASLAFALCQVPSEMRKSALDFGCGIGTVALAVANHGYRVTIADVPGPSFDFAIHRLRRRNVAYDVIPVKAEDTKFAENYSFIVSIDVLEHLPRPTRALRDLTAALIPGGIAHISTAFQCQDDAHPDHIKGHDKRFSPCYWEMETSAAGLNQIAPFVYRKVGTATVAFRFLRYLLWRRTGLYVTRIPNTFCDE